MAARSSRFARRRLPLFVLGTALLALTPLASADIQLPDKPDRFVVDRAKVLDATRAHSLNEKLASFERETSDQIVVDVEKKLPEGTTLEEVANRAFREWKIGQKGKSNGALFLVFVEDRKMRIEVGYGLEGSIPDLRAHRITDEIVKPWFRKGDYTSGVEAGVDALLAAARGETYHGTGRTTAEASRAGASRSIRNIVLAVAAILLLAVPGIALWKRRSGNRALRKPKPKRPDLGLRRDFDESSLSSWSVSSSSSWDSSPSTDDSWSDFSGGGGDSGGGGSSDDW